MDEITMFAELAPPPPGEAEAMQGRVRARLDAALTGTGSQTGAGPARGRPRRRRRMVLGLVTAAAVACAAIVAPTVLLGSSNVPLVTQAWAVQRNPNGTITVTVRQLEHPAGLEQALRAEGIPAYVRSVPDVAIKQGNQISQVPACIYEPKYRTSYSLFNKVFSFPKAALIDKLAFIIHPAAMPRGTAVLIQTEWQPRQVAKEVGFTSTGGGSFSLTNDSQGPGPCRSNVP